jgi:ABC-2 type transport system ATP-binding protein
VRIEASVLTRRFGDHVALDSLDLTIEPGESFGLLGANGAGKTTFIRLITGFLIPSSGSIRVDGISPVTDPRRVQEQLGYVAETSRLYPDLRVTGYLRFAGGIHGLSGATLDQAVDRVVARFQLEEVAGRLIGNLSKGYQQRVSLAQAFLHEPRLLIVDEPTGGLDPLQQAEVRDSLAEDAGRRTLVLCTHELEEARALTTRVAILSRGHLIRVGPTDEILDDGNVLDLFRGHTSSAA